MRRSASTGAGLGGGGYGVGDRIVDGAAGTAHDGGYRGGIETVFRRAESSSFFGREIDKFAKIVKSSGAKPDS